MNKTVEFTSEFQERIKKELKEKIVERGDELYDTSQAVAISRFNLMLVNIQNSFNSITYGITDHSSIRVVEPNLEALVSINYTFNVFFNI